MNEVWIIAEQRLGRLQSISLELLGKGVELARKLGVELAAVLLGDDVSGLTSELICHGADKVYLYQDAWLRLYQSEPYTCLVAELIKTEKPQIVLAGATSIGQDLVSRVAAKVGTGLTAHCADLYIDEDSGEHKLVAVVPGWGGSIMIQIACPQRRPQMTTVSLGVMKKLSSDERKRGKVIRLNVNMKAELKVETLEMVEEEPSGVSLDDAGVVVAGGWGLCSVGGFQPVEKLAKILGGVVAGTRPAVDYGWIPKHSMIGQSGRAVSPRLFISIGASGAPQFTSGFTGARVVMAIDQNTNAPIFEATDIGLVGDLLEILPCLVAELEESPLHV